MKLKWNFAEVYRDVGDFSYGARQVPPTPRQVGMKKNFQLENERHKPARMVDQIKSEVRKYLKRERKKDLSGEFDFWDFDCRQGKTVEEAVELHEKEIGKAIDHAVSESWSTIYLEILAKPRKREKKAKA